MRYPPERWRSLQALSAERIHMRTPFGNAEMPLSTAAARVELSYRSYWKPLVVTNNTAGTVTAAVASSARRSVSSAPSQDSRAAVNGHEASSDPLAPPGVNPIG